MKTASFLLAAMGLCLIGCRDWASSDLTNASRYHESLLVLRTDGTLIQLNDHHIQSDALLGAGVILDKTGAEAGEFSGAILFRDIRFVGEVETAKSRTIFIGIWLVVFVVYGWLLNRNQTSAKPASGYHL